MIKIKILFYIKSVKDIKYMFRFPTENKVLNISGRQTFRFFFINGSRSRHRMSVALVGMIIFYFIL
jgi:hypothetical protein